MILFCKGNIVHFFCTVIWRVKIKESLGTVIYLNQFVLILLLDNNRRKPLAYNGKVFGRFLQCFCCATKLSAVRPERNPHFYKIPCCPLNIGKATALKLLKGVQKHFSGIIKTADFTLKLTAVILYAAHQVHKLTITIVIDLYLCMLVFI